MGQPTTTKRPSFLSGAGILTLSALTVKVIADAVSHRIIGAQIVSEEDVTGRINWLTAAIIDGNTAEDFIVRAENAYCPPTNQVRDVVLAAVDDLITKL